MQLKVGKRRPGEESYTNNVQTDGLKATLAWSSVLTYVQNVWWGALLLAICILASFPDLLAHFPLFDRPFFSLSSFLSSVISHPRERMSATVSSSADPAIEVEPGLAAVSPIMSVSNPAL